MQRLNYLESQLPQNTMLRGRQVASIEEVKAIPIDFDGSVFYFPDLSNGRIYTKQIGLNGQSLLQMYELTEIPTLANNDKLYVTKEEFTTMVNSLTEQLNTLKQGGAKANDEQQQPTKFTF